MSANTETMVAVIGPEVMDSAEHELERSITEIEFQAGAITIDTDEDYQAAAEFGRLLKQKSSDVKEFFKPLKDAAHKAHAQICSREKAMLKPLESAEKILKQTMGSYVQEQERKRREAEEAARKAAREEAERKLREAIAMEAKGDAEGAALAMDEAEIMDDAAAAVSVTIAAPKAKGVINKKDWEIVSIDTSVVPNEVAGIEIRPVDRAAVMRLIRSSKGQVKIPGVVYKETVQTGFRK